MRVNTARTDIIIVVSCYITVASIVLYYNMTHPLVNDGVQEYLEYLKNVGSGWEYRATFLNSCLVTTWIPALISKGLGLDSYIVFRMFPAILYPLMAVFVYLIARRYLEVKYALIAVAVVVTNSHILYFPDIGRVGVAIGFMAGMTWGLLGRRLIWAIVFGVLAILTHYGITLIVVGLVGFVSFGLLIWGRKFEKRYFLVFGILVSVMFVWQFNVAGFSGPMMTQILLQERGLASSGGWGDAGLMDNPDFFDVTDREPAVQDALGVDAASMTIPKKLEIASNWLVVLLVTLGLYVLMRIKTIDRPFKLMAIGLYALILCTISIPWLSMYYGGMRVYFTSLIVLASCFPLGARWLATKMKLLPFALIVPILLFYALSTSGIVYLPFGLAKYFTVVPHTAICIID